MADPRELMQRYQAGDAEAFRELYALVAPKMLGYLSKLTKSRASADDIVVATQILLTGQERMPALSAREIPSVRYENQMGV